MSHQDKDAWSKDEFVFSLSTPDAEKSKRMGLQAGDQFASNKSRVTAKGAPLPLKPKTYSNQLNNLSAISRLPSVPQFAKSGGLKIVPGQSLSTARENVAATAVLEMQVIHTIQNKRRESEGRAFGREQPSVLVLGEIKGTRYQVKDSLATLSSPPAARMRAPTPSQEKANNGPSSSSADTVSFSQEKPSHSRYFDKSDNDNIDNNNGRALAQTRTPGEKESDANFPQRSTRAAALHSAKKEKEKRQELAREREREKKKAKEPAVIDLCDSDSADEERERERQRELQREAQKELQRESHKTPDIRRVFENIRNIANGGNTAFKESERERKVRDLPPSNSSLHALASSLIEVNAVFFGPLGFSSAAMPWSLGVRFVGGRTKALEVNFMELEGRVVKETIAFEHIKAVCEKENKEKNEIVFGLKVSQNLSLQYIPTGSGPNVLLNVKAREWKRKTILFAMNRAEANLFREWKDLSLLDLSPDQRDGVPPIDFFSAYDHPLSGNEREQILEDIENERRLQEERDRVREERASRRRMVTRNNVIASEPQENDAKVFCIFPPQLEVVDAITIHYADLRRLLPGVYFNDSLIDIKIKHLVSLLPKEMESKVHAFSCTFYTKLTEAKELTRQHDLVARWTKNVDLFEKDFIFCPINLNNHWSLVVIVRPNLLETIEQRMAEEEKIAQQKKGAPIELETDEEKEKESERTVEEDNLPCVLHMDSLNMHPTEKIYKHIAHYLFREREAARKRRSAAAASSSSSSSSSSSAKQESVSERAETMEEEEHSERYKKFERCLKRVKCKVPSQENGYDCGVFVTRFAQMVLDRWPTSQQTDIKTHFREHFSREFTQSDIDGERVAIEILLGELRTEYLECRAREPSNESEEDEDIAEDEETAMECDDKQTNEDSKPHIPLEEHAEAKEEETADRDAKNEECRRLFDRNVYRSSSPIERISSPTTEVLIESSMSSSSYLSARDNDENDNWLGVENLAVTPTHTPSRAHHTESVSLTPHSDIDNVPSTRRRLTEERDSQAEHTQDEPKSALKRKREEEQEVIDVDEDEAEESDVTHAIAEREEHEKDGEHGNKEEEKEEEEEEEGERTKHKKHKKHKKEKKDKRAKRMKTDSSSQCDFPFSPESSLLSAVSPGSAEHDVSLISPSKNVKTPSKTPSKTPAKATPGFQGMFKKAQTEHRL